MFKSLILAFCLLGYMFLFLAGLSVEASETLIEQKIGLELTLEQEEQINKILEEEPSFAEFQKHVLKFAAIPSAAEFKKFRKQARLRNALPNLSSNLDFGRNGYSDLAQSSDYAITRPNDGATSSTSYNLTEDQPRISSVGGNLTYNNNDWANSNDAFRRNNWDKALSLDLEINFSGLVYDDEVTDILSEQRRFATIRSDYMDRAFDAYHERRKKQISLILSPPLSKTEKIMAEIELQGLTNRLDSLTGGWFSKTLMRKGAIK